MNRPDQAPEDAPSSGGFVEARSRKRQLLADLRESWQDGRALRPEELLKHWPGNPQTDPDVASLLLEDYCQRRQQGEQPNSEEYSCRFPSQRQSLSGLSQQQGLFRSLGGAPGPGLFLSLPDVGDDVFGFHLCDELGRGSFARVFLAQQRGLADRPVVLKVSAIEGDEPQTLAQLQHTHIVPIYSVHEDPAAGLRAVCMPYFGGASLARVLEAVWSRSTRPTEGAQLARALRTFCQRQSTFRENSDRLLPFTTQPAADSSQPLSSLSMPGKQSRDGLARLTELSYIRAAAWITACLAEALQHAHDCGVLHRDIKPSNVLLSADGQPMLLDFNLSQSLTADSAQALATLGGTVAYMAPEHLRALAGRDPILVRKVDQRADIYGLGMVLYEMLTGRRPFEQSASYSPVPALIEAMALERGRTLPSLREHRLDVPWSLESISRKCLAPDADQRYSRAEHLAEDLHRFLADRPLKYAPELSWRERGGKWVRRHPRAASTGAVSLAAGVLLLFGSAGFMTLRARLQASEFRVWQAAGAQVQILKLDFLKGTERARVLVNTTTDSPGQLDEGLKVCEQTLAVYGIFDHPKWQQNPAWQRLDSADRLTVAEDARELLLLLSAGRVRRAVDGLGARLYARAAAALQPGSAPIPTGLSTVAVSAALVLCGGDELAVYEQALTDELTGALELLERAEAIQGLPPSAALWEDRAAYLGQLGRLDESTRALARARELSPADTRDHYLLALSCIRNRQLERAIGELKHALHRSPGHYWSLFLLGICHTQQGQDALAEGDFSGCVHLWPEFAWGYFNRAVVLQHLGQSAEALEDYNAALERDSKLTEAHRNRGLLFLELQRPGEALTDLDAVVAQGGDDVALHASRGVALEALGQSQAADVAFAQAWQHDPNHVDSLLAYGFAVSRRRPEQAQAAFLRVLDLQPRNPKAWYGRAMLFAQQQRQSASALTCFSLALQADPSFVAARCGRANVLAHRGEWDLAFQDIEWCLGAERRSGVTLYAAACVYALAAQSQGGEWGHALADRSLLLLRQAFEQGYGKDRADRDSDLDGLRNYGEFRELLSQTQAPPRKKAVLD
jgi:serine/threonine protein kinase/tetratricopeptide (TPR) repeat protein